jgi:hypothetical protein
VKLGSSRFSIKPHFNTQTKDSKSGDSSLTKHRTGS